MKLTTARLKKLIKEELSEMALSDEEMMKRMKKMDRMSTDMDVSAGAEMDDSMEAQKLLDQSIQFFEDTLGAGQELSPEMEMKVEELMKKAQMALGYAQYLE